jgi:predicted enzyme related to lactoylglutathione lyase
MAIARFSLVALDCPDPHSLAAFYRTVVGGDINQSTASDEWVRLQTGTGADIGFQKDPNYRAPDWPEGEPQHAHLDFDVLDLDEGEKAVLALGAVKASTQPSPDEWRVFLDPVGHPFCLCLATA